MVTLRKASIHCPKCGAPITVRDNGGMTREQADGIWKAVDRMWLEVDKLFRAAFK